MLTKLEQPVQSPEVEVCPAGSGAAGALCTWSGWSEQE